MSGSISRPRMRGRGSQSRGSRSRVSRRAVLALIDKVLDTTSGFSSGDSSDSHFDSEAENIQPGLAPRHARRVHSSRHLHTEDVVPRQKKRRLVHESNDSPASRLHADDHMQWPLNDSLPSWARPEAIRELGQEVATVVGRVAPRWLAEDPATVYDLEVGLAKVVADFALSHDLGVDQTTAHHSDNEIRSESNARHVGQRRSSNFGHGAAWDKPPVPRIIARGYQVEPPTNIRNVQHPQRFTSSVGPASLMGETPEGVSDASEDEQIEDERLELSDQMLQDQSELMIQHQPSVRAQWRKWNEEDVNKLWELLRSGMSPREAATHFPHRTLQAVKSRIARFESLPEVSDSRTSL